MRGQKGITLVALIITIVVLLIIAVVSIGVIDNSRIMNHAQNASTSYEAGKVYENTQVETAEKILNNVVKDLKITTK